MVGIFNDSGVWSHHLPGNEVVKLEILGGGEQQLETQLLFLLLMDAEVDVRAALDVEILTLTHFHVCHQQSLLSHHYHIPQKAEEYQEGLQGLEQEEKVGENY